MLLNDLPATEREERLFEILNHLNISRTLITQPTQIEELVQLNLLAGRKAKTSTAYEAAYTYITTAIELLPANCWETHYEMSLALSKERAEIEYLNGNFETAKVWLELTLAQARTPMEKAEVYKMAIVQYTLRAEYPEAIQAGRAALALINIHLPEENFHAARDAELAIVETHLQNRSFSCLAQLPMMTDPEAKMAIALLISMGPPTYRSHQQLWSVICAKAVNLCWEYGNTPEIGYIYPAFGSLRGYALNNYQNTGELLQVTLNLMQSFNNKSAESVAYLMIGSSLRHWSHPLKVATEDYLASYRVGLESSNLQYAAYAFGHNMYCRFYQSFALENLWTEIADSLAFSRKYKNQWAIDLLRGGQAIIAEFMEIKAELSAPDEEFSETAYLTECRQHKNSQVICIYNILKTEFLFFEERYGEAFEYAQQADAEIINVAPQGLLPYIRHLFIYALLLIALYPYASATGKIEYREKISTYQNRLEIWANNCPENFLHLFSLVKGEVARMEGNFLEAIDLYDLAIGKSQENEFIQDEALANELAAKFYLEWGKEKVATVYMQEAYYCYARWGAKAKTSDLEKRYAQLLKPNRSQRQVNQNAAETITNVTHDSTPIENYLTTSINSSTSISDLIDLNSIIKAAQVISSYIELDQLILHLNKIILENSGAKKAILMLGQENIWQVRVITMINQDKSSPSLIQNLLVTEEIDHCEYIPRQIINYVKHTGKSVIIDKCQPNISGLTDEYILQHQPQSGLCTSILHQGHKLGILYLENRITTGVFTPERLQVIHLLSAQAAISIENARLYQQAQQALQDLQQAQLQIVQSEKMSALGNLVAGIAHEMNNPLGFIAATLAQTKTTVADIIHHLKLYQDTFPHQSEEIIEHATEVDLNYISADLPQMIESMNIACNRLKNISTSLRTFSRADQDHPVLFNIHEGIESTILILKHRLKGHEKYPAIEVIKEFGDLPQIECFPGQLNQVFMNILANAIDALGDLNERRSLEEIKLKPSRITIKTSADNHQVKISIADNGIGMNETVRTKIFDHLFTTKAVGKGTGLGLAIARQIVVDKHGGTITVNSVLGEGSEFVISLPFQASI